jgi:hypothetical protein
VIRWVLLCGFTLGCEPVKHKDDGPCHDEVQSFGSVYHFRCHKAASLTRDGEWWKCVCPRAAGFDVRTEGK